MSTISKVNTETLLAHVLAPIAETEEQADTKAFRKEINREIYRKWHIEKENLRQETILRFAERIKNGDSSEAQRLWKVQLEMETVNAFSWFQLR